MDSSSFLVFALVLFVRHFQFLSVLVLSSFLSLCVLVRSCASLSVFVRPCPFCTSLSVLVRPCLFHACPVFMLVHLFPCLPVFFHACPSFLMLVCLFYACLSFLCLSVFFMLGLLFHACPSFSMLVLLFLCLSVLFRPCPFFFVLVCPCPFYFS